MNLTRTAKQLKLSEYYKHCLAISTTLCELNEINGVNILVEDESLPWTERMTLLIVPRPW